MARGRGKNRKKNKARKLRKLKKVRTPSANPPEELWLDRRAGARNIAGVRYQLRLTLTVLARAAQGDFPAAALLPEGMEDIDTVPVQGERHRFLQAKEVATDSRTLGTGALADFLEHSIPLLRRDPDALAALVTNGSFGGGLGSTGWDTALVPSDELTRTLAAAIEGVDPGELDGILRRVHLVEEPADLDVVVNEIASSHHIDPAIAHLGLCTCLDKVLDTSAEQSLAPIDRPVTLTVNDLDAAIDAAKRSVAAGASIDQLRRVATPVTFRNRSQLTEREFLDGVDVRPEHIAADLDVPRAEYLDEIARGIDGDRLVVIVGPSGAGKSALLWRTAAEQATSMRVWRVHRLADDDDADLLLTTVEQQRPSPGFPLLLCVDDLGRPQCSAWRQAATALLEVPGVYLLAAAREEDFSVEDALHRAVIVRPALNRATAKQIERVLSARGIAPAMAVDEAFPNSSGLLMEFLHLVVSGRRLSAVLADQAAGLEEPARHTELVATRYVTAAHRVGLEADAGALEARLPAPELAAALRRLEREHLLVESRTGRWTGLHELRSTELSKRLHERPPPTQAETLALVIADAEARPAAARLPEILAAAQEPEPIAAALVARVRTADAVEAAEWLEGARLADVADHAKRCADVARRLPLPTTLNVPQWLFMAYIGRFAGVESSMLGREHHEHAAQLPGPQNDLHERAVSSLAPANWVNRVELADPHARARLLEALEGAVRWDADTTAALAACVPGADPLADARLVASVHRSCIDDLTRDAFLGSLASPLERLGFLRDVWPLLTDAEFNATTMVVKTRFIHPVDGRESPEARAAELAAVLLDLIPEAKRAEVSVTRYDGADLWLHGRPGPHKAIPRANHAPHAVTRWNRAFHDFVEQEFASPSLTARLRSQASTVTLAAKVVVSAVEQMMGFDADGHAARKRWTRGSDRLQREIAGLKALPPIGPVTLSPLGSPPRERSDDAAQALEAIATATRLFSEALVDDLDVRRHKMRLVGTNLRTAAGHYRAALAVGTARLSGEPSPLDPALLDTLTAAATYMIGFADGSPVAPLSGRLAADQLHALADHTSEEQLRAERELLDEALRTVPGMDLSHALLVDPGDKPMVVPDPRRWLVPTSPDQLGSVTEALLALMGEATVTHPLAFRVIIAPARGAAVYNYPGLVIAAKSAYPIDLGEMRGLAADAELALLSGRYVDEVAACIECLARASRAAVAAHAMDGTRQSPTLVELSNAELHRARDLIGAIELGDVAEPLNAVVGMVAEELAGTETGALALEFDDAQTQSIVGPRLEVLEAATQAAALAMS